MASCRRTSPAATEPVTRDAEPPEHLGERRRFLVWALMLGAVPPERLTERVLRDVEAEATP